MRIVRNIFARIEEENRRKKKYPRDSLLHPSIYLCNPSDCIMSSAPIKRGISKTKDQSSKKKKNSSIVSSSSASHHHSAPPSHHQLSKSGLDAIHENGEDEQQNSTRFPRSSTVPYPAYATVRKSDGNSPQIYQTDDVILQPGTVSPGQISSYYTTRQPLAVVNTNFEPISPQHQLYGTRPVDLLKPTFLIVPKAAEQRLIAQLSASNSPVFTKKNKSTVKNSPSMTRHTNIRNSSQSPKTITTMDTGHRHIGLVATPNPSPYVHFANVTYSKPQPLEEPLPLTTQIEDYHQTINTSIRSMPNISLAQRKSFIL